MSTPASWPEWLLSNESVRNSLERMSAAYEGLQSQTTSTPTIKRFVVQQMSKPLADLEALGYMANGCNDVPEELRHAMLPKSLGAAVLCDVASPHQDLQYFMLSSRISMVRLLNGLFLCLRDGDLLVPFIILRSVVEQVALLASIVGYLRKQSESNRYKIAWTTLMQIREWLHRRVLGTRVNWTLTVTKPAIISMTKKEVGYKHRNDAIDRMASSVMDAIDDLNKVVEGTRAVYEILCEFAHPNVGTVMLSIKKNVSIQDKNGVLWHEHHFYSGPPTWFLEVTGETVPRILVCGSACIEEYRRLLKAAEKEQSKLLRLSQTVIRHDLLESSATLDSYEACPCGSGNKFKFCCGVARNSMN